MVRHLRKRLGIHVSENEISEAVNNWQRDNEKTIWLPYAAKVVRSLHGQGNILVLITNITWPAWITVNSQLHVEKYFDYLFLSCNEGISKPNPQVWHTVERRFMGQAVKYWMIGDSQTDDLHIPAEREWKTILVGEKGTPLAEIPKIIYGGAK